MEKERQEPFAYDYYNTQKCRIQRELERAGTYFATFLRGKERRQDEAENHGRSEEKLSNHGAELGKRGIKLGKLAMIAEKHDKFAKKHGTFAEKRGTFAQLCAAFAEKLPVLAPLFHRRHRRTKPLSNGLPKPPRLYAKIETCRGIISPCFSGAGVSTGRFEAGSKSAVRFVSA